MRLQLIIDDEVGRHEEARPSHVVQDEQNAGRHQDGERSQTDTGGDEPSLVGCTPNGI